MLGDIGFRVIFHCFRGTDRAQIIRMMAGSIQCEPTKLEEAEEEYNKVIRLSKEIPTEKGYKFVCLCAIVDTKTGSIIKNQVI